jgi:hypothetical protein
MDIPPNDPSLDPNLSLTKKSSKTPMIAIGVAVAAVVGFFSWQSVKKRDERKMHAAFMESFADVEKNDVGKFWACVLGPNVDVGAFPDNLALSMKITSQFGIDAKNYPAHVREECTPKAMDAKHKLESLSPPAVYGEDLKKYETSLGELASAFDAWSKVAPAQVQEMEVGKKVGTFGAAWHAFEGGKPGNDVLAYDAFVRCAIPSVDGMKDGQAVVEYLFKECKNPAYITRVQNDCGGKLLQEPPPAADKKLNATLHKLQADDRELSAFDDCLRKGRKGKRRDDLADVGRAWVNFMEAGRSVRKIGKEALKTE